MLAAIINEFDRMTPNICEKILPRRAMFLIVAVE
jgi:hypothetical protein